MIKYFNADNDIGFLTIRNCFSMVFKADIRMCTKHRNFIPLIDYICLLPKSVERDITNDNAEMLYFVTARFSVCFITVI